MKTIDINNLSSKYTVRRLNENDIDIIYNFCDKNTTYYKYCGKPVTKEIISSDLIITPPNIPSSQKYYIGFFDKDNLAAIMDLIDGYPEIDNAYIGFFMMSVDYQNKNIGSFIIYEVLHYLKTLGFNKCLLGIDKDNPQSNHFWKKNHFKVIKEVQREQGTILVAERIL